MAESILTFTPKEFDEAVERELNRRVRALCDQIAADGGMQSGQPCSESEFAQIPKLTADERLAAIRKIVGGCDWLYQYNDQGVATGDVEVFMDCEVWDELKALLLLI